MMGLVIINSKKEAVTSHIIISKGMKVTQESTQELIKKYKNDLKDFGVIRFQNGKPPEKGGRPKKEYMLNRDQAMFLITLMRNNPATVEFKKSLVKQFIAMECWIKDRMQSSVEYKVMSAILKDSRQLAGKETSSFHYANEANLVNWAISGEFKSLERDSLALHDIELLNELQARNAVLIGAGLSRDKRKESLRLMVELRRNQLMEAA